MTSVGSRLGGGVGSISKVLKRFLPKIISKTTGGLLLGMLAAAVDIGMAVAEVVKKAAYEKKLRANAQKTHRFKVSEYLNVPASELENRKSALFTLMVKHLIANPANNDRLTLALPPVLSSMISTAEEADAVAASRGIFPKVKFYAENGLTLDEALEVAKQNAWALATESEVRNAWAHHQLNLALLGLIADGRLSFPVQEDQFDFKIGPNIGVTGDIQGFFYTNPKDLSDEGPKEVKFHAQNSMSLVQAQALGQQNFWALATELQVRDAWTYHNLDQYAFGMMADERFAMPIQTDRGNENKRFKKGPNIGVTGGNQGFFYTERAVKFHHQNSMTLAEAQELAELNTWTLATENEIQIAWQKGILDVFAYGMMADGRIALPIQTNRSNENVAFKKGPNIGITGGNQGFFYTEAI